MSKDDDSNDRSTDVQRPFNPMDFSKDHDCLVDGQAMADLGPLAGVELTRKGHNFHWGFPDGSSRPASMTEVLLYEILYHVSAIGVEDEDGSYRPTDTPDNS